MRRIHRPSPSMVVACLALGVALSGTAVAASVALAPNSVGTAQLKTNAVTTGKVRNGALLLADFKAGQIPAGPAGPAGAAGEKGPAGATGPVGPAGPSDAYVKVVPVVVDLANFDKAIAILPIRQPGTYAIWAKLYFEKIGVLTRYGVFCGLYKGLGNDLIDQSASNGDSDTLALNVVTELGRFNAAIDGGVRLECVSQGGLARASNIKITAIKVATLTTSG